MKYFEPIYDDGPTVIMPIEGIICKVTVTVRYNEKIWMPIDADVIIEPTDEPFINKDNYKDSYFKFGGYPEFRQGEVVPMSHDNKQYTFICSILNNWGDMGTGNVFALVRVNDNKITVEDVFVEASCS